MKPMKPLEPIRKGSEEANTWWPPELGQPSVSGSSDGLRYAYFSAKHRLAVDDGRKIRLYDTGSKDISGFSASNGRDLTFQTADGAKKLSSLKLLEEPYIRFADRAGAIHPDDTDRLQRMRLQLPPLCS